MGNAQHLDANGSASAHITCFDVISLPAPSNYLNSSWLAMFDPNFCPGLLNSPRSPFIWQEKACDQQYELVVSVASGLKSTCSTGSGTPSVSKVVGRCCSVFIYHRHWENDRLCLIASRGHKPDGCSLHTTRPQDHCKTPWTSRVQINKDWGQANTNEKCSRSTI